MYYSFRFYVLGNFNAGNKSIVTVKMAMIVLDVYNVYTYQIKKKTFCNKSSFY